ncbi:hypothetical protein CBR_g22209 [Chara braunii]|uniref:Uncharacterized protein n=1 Tax=Chara braunii TaxID=69332 RepID=A0A388L2D7_CHABU|nr:hypothetical protein CBR_g22209 [Chara braunii]|eukprot:GBG76461.1 hypothetical protein CBR_g22209 [Chara braunii]
MNPNHTTTMSRNSAAPSPASLELGWIRTTRFCGWTLMLGRARVFARPVLCALSVLSGRTPPDPAVGMSDDSEDERARAPLKLGLQGSRRQGLLGESPIRTSLGGGLGERLEQASGSRSPQRLVARVGAFISSREVADLTAGDRPGASWVREVRGAANTTRSVRPAPAHLQTEASPRGEAGGNVAGEEEVLELGATHESSPVTSQSGGKRNLPLDEGREGLAALKRQRKQGGSARTPMTEERGSVDKRKRVGGGDDTPKDSSTQRRTSESSGKRSKSAKGKKADEGDTGEGDDDVEINVNTFNLDRAFFLGMKTGVQRDVVLHIHPERILPIPDWEDAYNHQSLDEFLVDTLAAAMIDCYARKDMRYTKPIFVLAPIVAPAEKDKPVVRVLPEDFDDSHPEKYWYYPVCGQHNARVAMKVADHAMFNYYNFCEWPFRPIYFPDDEFDGYTHVLDDKLWNESRKFFNDTTYVNKCPQYLGFQHENNVKKTTALVNDPHFPAEWKRVVLSVLTGERAQSRKGPRGIDECINILWRKTSVVTTLAPFVVDPLNAMDHKDTLGKLGHQLRSHTCVLDLCGTVDRTRWDSGAFASLSEFLGFICQDYWTLVVFIPCLWDLSFMTCLAALGATRCYTGKWVRKTAAKKTHRFGNSMWEEPDVMHILFKGEDPWLLTQPVFEGAVAADDAAALRRKQKVTPVDVEERPFKSLQFADFGNHNQKGVVYKDFERNSNQLSSHFLFFCVVADGMLFLGNLHALVVWNLLHQGRHVLALDGDSMQLEYTSQFVAHEVQSGAYACDFHHVVVEPVYDPNKDMFFKLTPKKRRQVYSFLFGHQPKWRVDEQFVMRKQVAIAVLQGYHGASRTSAVGFMKRLEYVFFDEGVVDPAGFTLNKYRLAFGDDDDFNIETEPEESVEDDLFDLEGQLAIFNAQVSESPSVCKPGTPLATPTSAGPTPVSSSVPVKRVGLSRLKTSPMESMRLSPLPEPYDVVLEKLSEVNRRCVDDPALRKYGDTIFELVQSNHWLEVTSAFYSLPLSPSIKQVSWDLPAITPPAAVVKRKSRGKDDEGDGQGGGQRGTGGGSAPRSTKEPAQGQEGGGEGRKGSREKKKQHSREKTKHHRGDGQGSDVDGNEDGGALAVTGSTSMETGKDFRPGWIPRPGEQDPVISSTSATEFIDAVGRADDAKDDTCPAQVQTPLAGCLGSIRTTRTTSLSGTQYPAGSKMTTYLGPHWGVRIDPNLEDSTVKRARWSTEVERMVRVSESIASQIRIHPNQEDDSAMTVDRYEDVVMLCTEARQELQADCPTLVVGVRDDAMDSLHGELPPTSNVQSCTLGDECLVTVSTKLAVLSDSPMEADTSAPPEIVGARMNPNQSYNDAGLEMAVIQMHPTHADAGLELAVVEDRGHVTSVDKTDGSSGMHSADDRIDPKPGDISMPRDTSGNEMGAVELDQRVQPGCDDPLYSDLRDEVMGEDILKKASDAAKDSLFYFSDDDKDTARDDKQFKGEEVMLDIDATLDPTDYDIVAMEKTQSIHVVDVDALSPERDIIKLDDPRHQDRKEVTPSMVIDADISNLSSFPGCLEHVVAASTRRGLPIVLGLPSAESDDVEAKPGKHSLFLLLPALLPVREVLFASLLRECSVAGRQLDVEDGVREVVFGLVLLRSCVVDLHLKFVGGYFLYRSTKSWKNKQFAGAAGPRQAVSPCCRRHWSWRCHRYVLWGH